MKRITLQSCLIGLTMAFQTMYAQEKVEVNPAENFNKIELSGNVDVEINVTTGLPCSYTINDVVDPNSVIVSIKEGALSISNSNKNKTSPRIAVNCPKLDALVMSGSGDCRSNTPIVADEFKIVVAGSGDATLVLDVKKLSTVVSGSADVKLSGKADEINVVVSGSGDLYALDLVTQSASAAVSGSGDVRINPSETLVATVSGTGGIFYKDEPKNKTINVSGNGEVDKVGASKDSTRVKVGRYKFIIIPDGKDSKDTVVKVKKDNYHHWSGFDLGVNMLFNAYNEYKVPGGYPYLKLNPGKSFNYRLNFYETNFNLYQEKINLVTGAGIEWSKFGIARKYEILADMDSLSAVATPYKFRKNQLRNLWFNVPLFLEFNTSNKESKSYHLAVGVIGGYRLGTKYKQEYVFSGKEYEYKIRDGFNMNDFKLDAMVRLGYGKYTAWAGYNLTGLFSKNQGPVAYPLTVGVTLVPFD